jgi:hypothetical protein
MLLMGRYLESMPVTLSAAKGLARPDTEILRCAQDDSQDTAQARSREAFSPKVYLMGGPLEGNKRICYVKHYDPPYQSR